jgi:hypothetical protein
MTLKYYNQAVALAGSGYFSNLTQYGTDGVVHVAGSAVDPVPFKTGAIFESTLIDFINNNPNVPRPGSVKGLVYVFVTQGVQFNPGDTKLGWNGVFRVNVSGGQISTTGAPNTDMPFIWDGGNVGVGDVFDPQFSSEDDAFTATLSHEVAELTTDYNETGYEIHSGPTWNLEGLGPVDQISEYEAAYYSYRLPASGILVQPFWSARDGAFVVPDGTANQNFYLDGHWTNWPLSGTPTGQVLWNERLEINGDQLGANYRDNITIDATPQGGVKVTLNGYTAQFEPGVISEIDVNAGGGNNIIQVNRVPWGLHVYVKNPNTTGSDAVFVGDGNLSDIAGTVDVMDYSLAGTIYVAAADGSAAPKITVTGGAVQDQGRTFLTYDREGSAYEHSLTVQLETVGGEVDVQGTFSRTPVNVFTWTGKNTVNIEGSGSPVVVSTTTGTDAINVDGSGAAVTLNTGAGTDSVTVGRGSASLSPLGGPVNVNASFGTVDLVVHNEGDLNSRSYTLTGSSFSYAGGPSVNFSGRFRSMVIFGGTGSLYGRAPSTYNILGAPNVPIVQIIAHRYDVAYGPAAGKVAFVLV